MPSMLRGYVQRHVLDIQLFEGFRRRELEKAIETVSVLDTGYSGTNIITPHDAD